MALTIHGQTDSLRLAARDGNALSASPSSTKVSAVAQALRARAAPLPWTGLSPLAGTATSNIGYTFLRAPVDSYTTVPGASPAFSFMGSNATTVSYQLMGMPTAQNAAWGAMGAMSACRGMEAAQRVGDEEGERAAKASLARNIFQGAGGAAFLPYRILATVAAVNNTSSASFAAPTALGKATFGTLTIGTAAFGGMYALLSVECALSVHEINKFLAKFEACPDDAAKYQFLRDSLEVTESEMAEIRAIKPDLLRKEAICHAGKELLAIADALRKSDNHDLLQVCDPLLVSYLKEMGLVDSTLDEIRKTLPSTQSECEIIFKKMVADQITRPEAFLVEMGLQVKAAKLKAKKEMILGRLIGADLVKVVREKTLPESEIVKAVAVKVQENKVLTSAELAIYLVGFVATVLALAFLTGGWGLAVAFILYLFVAVGMMITDGARLHQAIKSGEVAKWDTKIITFNMVLITLMMIASLVVTCVFFPPAIFPILMALLIWAGGVGVNGYALYKAKEAQNKKAASVIEPDSALLARQQEEYRQFLLQLMAYSRS